MIVGLYFLVKCLYTYACFILKDYFRIINRCKKIVDFSGRLVLCSSGPSGPSYRPVQSSGDVSGRLRVPGNQCLLQSTFCAKQTTFALFSQNLFLKLSQK